MCNLEELTWTQLQSNPNRAIEQDLKETTT